MKNSKKNNNTRKNKITTNKTLKKNANNCKCNKCIKYKNKKLHLWKFKTPHKREVFNDKDFTDNVKKGGNSITNIDIMTYPSALLPVKLLKDVTIYKTNSNIANSFKSLIYDTENSLAILKSELTDKSYPKKAYVKKIKVE